MSHTLVRQETSNLSHVVEQNNKQVLILCTRKKKRNIFNMKANASTVTEPKENIFRMSTVCQIAFTRRILMNAI
jgi:Cys-tRNA synthase (O-phospho-L-seryl-tRNA:Cys-tRNA synthase)